MSNEWSSFQEDRAIMEDWRGYLGEELVSEEIEQMMLDEGMMESAKEIIQQFGAFLSKLWSDPEFRDAEATDATDAIIKAKDATVDFVKNLSDDSLRIIGKILIAKLKLTRKPVNKRNLYEALLPLVKFVFKGGGKMARAKLGMATLGASEVLIRIVTKMTQDESGDSGVDAGMEEVFVTAQNIIFQQMIALPEIAQALQAGEESSEPEGRAPQADPYGTAARQAFAAEGVDREFPTERWQQLASIKKRTL